MKKSAYTDRDNYLGEDTHDIKKRGRKSKKPNDKEFYFEL